MKHAEKKIYLYPGDFAFGHAGLHIHTLLGSCVSITLWHPEKIIGGMCHFALPGHPKTSSSDAQPNGRYAEGAMELFRQAIIKHGTRFCDYQAKLFGGGNMMKDIEHNADNAVGQHNVTAARKLLEQNGVNILSSQVGGYGHRRIVFDISSGDVWVKHLQTTEP